MSRIIIACILLSILLSTSVLCQEISVVVVGDMMFGPDVSKIVDREGSTVPFADTIEYLKNADVTFGLLEGGIGTSGEAVENLEHSFRSKPSAARGLANAGFDIVSIATPHIMDYGEPGFLDTMEYLSWYGLKYVGGGKNVEEARKPVVLSAGNKKVAFLAYHRGKQFDPLFAGSNKPGPALSIYGELEKDVAAAKEQADFVIASIHWGIPMQKLEGLTSHQKLYAQKLIDSGADVVLGQWLHTLQGIEIYKGKPVAYSLGDFIYGTYAKETPVGFILKFVFSSDEILRMEIIPLATSDARLAEYFPKVLHDQAAKDALTTLSKKSEEFGTEIQVKGDIGIIDLKQVANPPHQVQ